jgi:hypothetical protein
MRRGWLQGAVAGRVFAAPDRSLRSVLDAVPRALVCLFCRLTVRLSLVSLPQRDVLDTSPGVTWGDIAGLQEAKRLLQENVILPLILPEYFQGIRRPVKASGGQEDSQPARWIRPLHGRGCGV